VTNTLEYAFDQRGHRHSKFDTVDMTTLKLLIDINPLMVTMVPSKAGLWACSKCDASQYSMVIDHEAKTITAPTECPVPAEGLITSYVLEVPSGGMVVANDLRDLWGIDPRLDDHHASYNSDLGQQQTILAYAALGMAYGPVGNSSPGLYPVGAGYEIANPAYLEHEEWDGWYEGEDSENPPLATIITDLWAYCIVDLNEFNRRGGDLVEQYATVVDVDPGSYMFTHHTGEASFKHDTNDRIVYTTITKVS